MNDMRSLFVVTGVLSVAMWSPVSWADKSKHGAESAPYIITDPPPGALVAEPIKKPPQEDLTPIKADLPTTRPDLVKPPTTTRSRAKSIDPDKAASIKKNLPTENVAPSKSPVVPSSPAEQSITKQHGDMLRDSQQARQIQELKEMNDKMQTEAIKGYAVDPMRRPGDTGGRPPIGSLPNQGGPGGPERAFTDPYTTKRGGQGKPGSVVDVMRDPRSAAKGAAAIGPNYFSSNTDGNLISNGWYMTSTADEEWHFSMGSGNRHINWAHDNGASRRYDINDQGEIVRIMEKTPSNNGSTVSVTTYETGSSNPTRVDIHYDRNGQVTGKYVNGESVPGYQHSELGALLKEQRARGGGASGSPNPNDEGAKADKGCSAAEYATGSKRCGHTARKNPNPGSNPGTAENAGQPVGARLKVNTDDLLVNPSPTDIQAQGQPKYTTPGQIGTGPGAKPLPPGGGDVPGKN